MKFTFLSVLALSLSIFISTNAYALTIAPARWEISTDPGTQVDGEMILINDQEEPRTFFSSFENFEAQGDSGSPKFIGVRDGLATWMDTQGSVILKAGESKTIPFSIKVPQGVEAGGYFGAIFWSTTPPAGGTNVTIGAKVGMLVFLTVKGDIKEAAGLQEFKTVNGKHYYKALPVGFEYRFSNDGGDRVRPTGSVTVRSILGWRVAKFNANPSDGSVLPRTIRKFNTEWHKQTNVAQFEDQKEGYSFFNEVKKEWHNFAIGIFTAKMKVEYGTNGQTAKSNSAVFIVFPPELSLILLIVIGGGYVVLKTLIRRYNKMIIRKARQSLN